MPRFDADYPPSGLRSVRLSASKLTGQQCCAGGDTLAATFTAGSRQLRGGISSGYRSAARARKSCCRDGAVALRLHAYSVG